MGSRWRSVAKDCKQNQSCKYYEFVVMFRSQGRTYCGNQHIETVYALLIATLAMTLRELQLHKEMPFVTFRMVDSWVGKKCGAKNDVKCTNNYRV